MLRITIHRLVLAQHTVNHTRRLLVIHFSLLPEVYAADPFMLYLLEGRLDLHNGG
jgi:hypothetical protein